MRSTPDLRIPVLAAFLVALLAALVPQPFWQADDSLYRRWMQQRNLGLTARDLQPAASQLVVVAIDDASPWPLPRHLYAEVVRRLKQAGATNIGLDVMFLSPDPEDGALLPVLSDPAVVVAAPLQAQGSQVRACLPYPANLGFSALPGDGHEVLAVWLQVDQTQYSWPVQVAARHLGCSPAQLVARTGLRSEAGLFEGVPVQRVEAWPDSPAQGLLSQQTRSWSSFLPVLTLHDLLLTPESGLTTLFGHEPFTAVVGVDHPGEPLLDSLAGGVSGFEVHLAELVNLLQGHFLVPTSPLEGLLLSLALGGLTALTWAHMRLRGASLATLCLVLTIFASGSGALTMAHRLLPVAAPISAVLAAAAASLGDQLLRARSRLRRLETLLTQLCPAPDPEQPLDPQPRRWTVLVTDLRGLLRLEDSRPLQRYLESAAGLQERFQGRVLSCQGPWMVSAFEEPVAACQAAAALQDCAPGPCHGLATGSGRLAWLGNQRRRQLGLLGAPLDQARRLAERASEANRQILLDQATREAAAEVILCQPLRPGSEVFELLGREMMEQGRVARQGNPLD